MAENDSYVRWQAIRINQLGFANNLIILLEIPVIGFYLKFLQSTIWIDGYKTFFLWTGGLLSVASIFIGILLTVIRLDNFALTAKIARKRETKKRDGIEDDRKETKELDAKTWCYFSWQVVTFLVSFLSAFVLVILSYSDKLF